MTSFLITFGLILWGTVLVLAIAVLYFARQPGYRRWHCDHNYPGPERRSDLTPIDFLSQPIFTRPGCKGCEKLLRRSKQSEESKEGKEWTSPLI